MREFQRALGIVVVSLLLLLLSNCTHPPYGYNTLATISGRRRSQIDWAILTQRAAPGLPDGQRSLPGSIAATDIPSRTISINALFHPSRLNTRLGLNQMELVVGIEAADDPMPLILPGAISRFVATLASFDRHGHLQLGEQAFWGGGNGISTLSKQDVFQIVVLEIREDLDTEWIENAVTDLYRFARPKAFIIGNELNLIIFRYSNPETYYHQLNVAYRTIKSMDPSVQVYPYGCSPSDLHIFERPDLVLEALLSYYEQNPYAPDQKYPFDGISYHAYLPNQIYGIQTVKDILTRHNIRLPILIGESGLHVNDVLPREWNSHLTVPEDQANYLWQSTALLFAQGADYVIYHTAMDFVALAKEQWGLYRRDGSARPAARAFKFAQRIFNNVEALKYTVSNDINILTLYRTDNLRARIIWNDSKEGQLFNDVTDSALFFDRYGKPVSPISLENGQIGIWLPGRYTALVAGDVVIIVDTEQDSTDAGSTKSDSTIHIHHFYQPQ